MTPSQKPCAREKQEDRRFEVNRAGLSSKEKKVLVDKTHEIHLVMNEFQQDDDHVAGQEHQPSFRSGDVVLETV